MEASGNTGPCNCQAARGPFGTNHALLVPHERDNRSRPPAVLPQSYFGSPPAGNGATP